MKENIATIATKALANLISDLGYELYEVEYAKKQNGMNLTLFITKQDEQITIEDCEKVHRLADKVLDDLNPTKDESYILNVSSLGLDRLLKTDKDFLRVLDKKVEITLFKPVLDKKQFIGVFESFDEEKVTLKDIEETKKSKKQVTAEQKTLTIDRKNLASCKLYVEI